MMRLQGTCVQQTIVTDGFLVYSTVLVHSFIQNDAPPRYLREAQLI